MLGRLFGKRPPNAKTGVTNNSWQYVPLIMLALESQGIFSDSTNWEFLPVYCKGSVEINRSI